MVSDNEVWITTDPRLTESDFQITTGHFVITDFKVTTGQDTTMTVDGDSWFNTKDGSGFHFGANRSNSGEVAQWLNSRVPSSQITFGHDASELNFAIKGTMTLFVKGSVFEDGQALTFESTYLAQGHTGLDNNWWFAISGAVPAGDNEIRAKDSSGNYWLRLLRGGSGNPDNTVYVYA